MRSDIARPEPVVLIPCSAGSARQWQRLIEQLNDFEAVPLELCGHGPGEHRRGASIISLDDEAAMLLANLPARGRFHLIGHSYGGAVALKIALTVPERLLSLTLIEPSCFNILNTAIAGEPDPLDPIRHVATRVQQSILSGDDRGAMATFIDFWSGAQTWDSLSETRKAQLAQIAFQIPIHFRALFEEPTSLLDYAAIAVPTLILSGTRSPRASREITRLLTETLPNARHRTVRDAGHMSPVTHPFEVNTFILEHLRTRRLSHRAVLTKSAPTVAA